MSATGPDPYFVHSSESSRHVVSSFWAAQFDESDDLSYLLEEEGSSGSFGEVLPFLLPSIQSKDSNLGNMHPTRLQANLLCNIYFRNIDPFFKLVHKARFIFDLEQFWQGILDHSARFEALLFAIYSLATMSMTHEYMTTHFPGETRVGLLDKFQVASDFALTRSNFLRSHSLVILQAFLLHIAFLFECKKSTQASALIGPAASIARRIGLHKDKDCSNLSPWQVEMRRRAWHFLRILDTKALESVGTESETFQPAYNPSLPKNLPDSAWEIYQTWPKAVQAEHGFTELTYSIVQSELAIILQSLLDPQHSLLMDMTSHVEFHESHIQDEKDRITRTYLRGLDFTDPIQSLVFMTTELFFSKAFLIVHQTLLRLPRDTAEISQELRDKLFTTAIGLCEISHNLELEYQEFQWGWLFRNSTQWLAIAIILTNLLHRTDDPNVPRAWRQIDIIFERHSQDTMGSGDAMLWKPLVKLWSDATARRKTQEEFKALDAETTPVVPDDDLGQNEDAVSEDRWDPLLFDATPSPFPL